MLQELRTKRDGLLREMQKLSQGNFSVDGCAKFDRMNADVELLETEIRRAEARSYRGHPGQDIEREPTNSAKAERHKEAFRNFIRKTRRAIF